MELKPNQAALILEADDNNEITVHVSSPDQEGLSAAICQAIAVKLMEDENFQNELMEMMEEGDEGHEEH
ncbi:twitching motility protein [Desulfopila inferna]|uniref:twitching motility protein n=1 Tax=Desulfopila inferna TaxID=468528 RepID=UPI0019652FC0|nr:twitching motility protein [Desulfopila inferna]MBM9604824.1 twitching motility protein [Desulfopila inferna]